MKKTTIATLRLRSKNPKWDNLPPDILSQIVKLLDKYTGIATLRLRSICHSWRLSLSSPFQPSLPQQSLFLLSNGAQFDKPFLMKVGPKQNGSDLFVLYDPLSKNRIQRKPIICGVDLCEYRVTLVCKSYFCSEFGFKKVVFVEGFFGEGDFVVLGLDFNGGLFVLRFGDVGWSQIVAPGRIFDDVISFKGKFYACADQKGRLVMIDSRLKPIDLVSRLVYGDGNWTSLVECDGNLYLVDRKVDGDEFKFGVFKLDDKGSFWDYEPDLNDCVFFLGDDVNFALSRKDYSGSVRNVIFFRDGFGVGGLNRVFDMKTSTCFRVDDSEECSSLYCPPWCKFNEG